jgi:hypothetical protein
MKQVFLLSVCLMVFIGTLVAHANVPGSLIDTTPPVETIKVIPRAVGQGVSNSSQSIKFDEKGRARYIGFNTSYLLQQILPFNAISLQQNMYAMTYRKYNWGKGWRYSMGMNLSELNELQWFAIRVDYDKRKQLKGRWKYMYGGGLGFEFFEDPDNQNFFFSSDQNLVAQLHWGVEYQANEVISLSMETQGILKMGFNPALILRAPTVITAHFKLN